MQLLFNLHTVGQSRVLVRRQKTLPPPILQKKTELRCFMNALYRACSIKPATIVTQTVCI